MKKKLLLMIILVFTSLSLRAGTTGKLAGKVIDKNSKEPLPFVNVIIEGTNFGAATDIDGNYVILNISPGSYNVRFQYVGYQAVLLENVPISVDLTTTRNVELTETALELGTVVVEGRGEKLQKDITSSQASVSSEQIESMPVAELTDIVKLQAGVTTDASGGFHIRGGRTTEIAYWVNGISITDPFDNSQGIQIDNSSVQELQVISGTFNAEYGNAMSGIINTVTKEGGPRYSGEIQVYSSDYASDFTSFFPNIDNFDPVANYNFQGSLSGPIPFTSDKVTFFFNGRYNYDDGYIFGIRRFNVNGTPGDGAFVPMDWSKRYLGQANLSYWLTKGIKLNGEALYSKEDFADYDTEDHHRYKLVPDGDVTKHSNSYNTTLTMTHMLSPSTFYTLKGSYFFKDFNEYAFEDPYDSRYLHPDSLNVINFAFRTQGANLHRFFRETQTFSGKLDFTSQVNQNHLIKIGGEVKFHQLALDDYTLEPKREGLTEIEPFQPSIPLETDPDRKIFDVEPNEFSLYFQDKIEYESVIINFGLRYDYFDAKGKVLVDPRDPNIYVALRPGMQELSIAEREPYYYKNSKPKSQLSPRFGIAYPVSETGVVHFSYGHFLQIPSFDFLYRNGQFKVGETGQNYGPFGNPDLDAQRTVMYEIGLRQEFFQDFLVDVTGFYRDVRNWIAAGPWMYTYNQVNYSVFMNKDYSNVRGITLTLSKRLSNYYSADINYTYQVAEGSNSKPEDEFEAAKNNNEPALFLIPMEWDQTHLFNANFYVGSQTWGASITGRYGTGLPYSPSITQYTSDRGISSGLLRNSRRKPNQFTIDLRLHKTFGVMGTGLTAFLRVFNLLDSRTAVNVFGDSGKPDFTSENIQESSARPNTVDEYRRYPWHYGEPRQVQFGFEFSF